MQYQYFECHLAAASHWATKWLFSSVAPEMIFQVGTFVIRLKKNSLFGSIKVILMELKWH